MDYCITGGNGFIGKNLDDFLQCKGKSTQIIDLVPRGNNSTICMDVAHCLPLTTHDTLVHLAAETNVRASIQVPCNTILRNIHSTLNCLNRLREGLVKSLIFTSSASSSKCFSPYLASKAACESLCTSFACSYFLNIRVLKLSNVYGPYSIHKESVIPKFIKNCLDNEPLTIYGSGNQSRDFIHVDDVVKAIYNGDQGFISSRKLYSIKLVAKMISDISHNLTGYYPRTTYENSIAGEVITPSTNSDIVPSVSLEEGLTTTFKWFMENYVSKSKHLV